MSGPANKSDRAAAMSTLKFDPPAEYVQEELMTSWRVPYEPNLKEPRLLQTQVPVRPNLVVHRRRVDEEQNLADVASLICDQLMRSIEGLSQIATSELVFRDGVNGLLLEFSFPAMGNYRVVQLEALRLDGDVLTTMTLCTEMSRITADEQQRLRACLASATLGGTP
jgi:hypothetical protein